MCLNICVTYVGVSYPREKLPFGFASKSASKREMKQTRLRLRQVSFLVRFDGDFDASFQAHLVGAAS
jgi:hypothetical protein